MTDPKPAPVPDVESVPVQWVVRAVKRREIIDRRRNLRRMDDALRRLWDRRGEGEGEDE